MIEKDASGSETLERPECFSPILVEPDAQWQVLDRPETGNKVILRRYSTGNKELEIRAFHLCKNFQGNALNE